MKPDPLHEALADLVEEMNDPTGRTPGERARALLAHAKWLLAAQGYRWDMRRGKFERPFANIRPSDGGGGVY